MDLLLDIVLDAGKDVASLVPFLFVTYLVLEALEHVAGDRVNGLVRRAGPAGPVVGALLGVVPQCGFSAMGATLYAGRVVTLGTLAAVFLSTSDEMIPMLVAERIDPAVMGEILGIKVLVALVTGVAIDFIVRALRERVRAGAPRRSLSRARHRDDARGDEDGGVIDQMAEAGQGASHIHRLCEQDHCGCDEPYGDSSHVRHGEEPVPARCGARGRDGHGHGDGSGACACSHSHDREGGALASIARSAISHTLQVSVFIFLVTLVLVAVLETVGEDALAGFLAGNEGLAIVASALVGLIPNCSASVVITQLYLEGVLGFAPMMSGLLVSAGVGYLVLFRTNRRPRENAVIVAGLFAIAVLWGLVIGALGLS